jgi:hypothetical protein
LTRLTSLLVPASNRWAVTGVTLQRPSDDGICRCTQSPVAE